MDFEWDPEKNRSNVTKHGIDFEDAISIFDGPVLEQITRNRGYCKVRSLAFGVANGRVFAVVYTLRDKERRRIISARRASRRERKEYHQAFPEKPAAR